MKRSRLSQGGAANIRALVIVIILFVASLIGIAIYNRLSAGPTTGPQGAGNKFMKAIIAEDTQTSYGMFTSNLKGQISSDQWKSELKQAFDSFHGKAKFVSITPVSNPEPAYGKNSDPQKLIYHLDYGGGKVYEMFIIVMKDKTGSWQINEFNSSLQ